MRIGFSILGKTVIRILMKTTLNLRTISQ
jgi:hypothetical protein